MSRDPYGYRSWGEQLFRGLLTLLAVAFGAQLLGALLAPLVPLLIGLVIAVGVVVWLFGTRHRW